MEPPLAADAAAESPAPDAPMDVDALKRRVASLRDEVRGCAAHEVGKAHAALQAGGDLVRGALGASPSAAVVDGVWERWVRFLLREGAPAWERSLGEDARAACVDDLLALDGAVKPWRVAAAVAEALVDGADPYAARGAGRVARRWCARDAAERLVASLRADAADAAAVERAVDALTRLPARLGALGRRSPLEPDAWFAHLAAAAVGEGGAAWPALATRLDRLGRTADAARAWVAARGSDDGSRLEALGAGVAGRYVPALLGACCVLPGPEAADAARNIVGPRLANCSVARALFAGSLALGRVPPNTPRRAAALVALLARTSDVELFGETLSAACRALADRAFVLEADEGRRAFVATVALCGIIVSSSEELDGLGILQHVVSSVSCHLDSSRPEDRVRGMLVGEAFGKVAAQTLHFDDLSDDDRAWGDAFLADGTLDAAPPNAAFAAARPAIAPAADPPPAEEPRTYTVSRGTPRPEKQARSPDDPVASGSESDESDGDKAEWRDGDDVDDGLSDDSSLEAYDLEDLGEDLAPVAAPVYLRDLLALLNKSHKNNDFARDEQLVALDCAEALVRAQPDDLGDVARDLAHALLTLDNRFDLPGFAERTSKTVAALAAARPLEVVGDYLCLQFFDRNLTISKKLDILCAMVDAAYELAGRKSLAAAGGSAELPGDVGGLLRLENAHGDANRSTRRDRGEGALALRTRRWGYRRNPARAPAPNRFAALAAGTFFFPLLRGVAEHWALIAKHSSQATLLKGRVMHALACFLECASTSPAASTLSSHLLAFAWADAAHEDPALRRVALAASLTALAHRGEGDGALALLTGGVAAGLPSVDDVQALSAQLAVHDPDPTARQLAVALGGILPTGF